MPVRDPKTPGSAGKPLKPSAYWGDEAIWDSQTNMHNPMFDEKGRVWFTSVIRPPDNPAFCKAGLGPSVGQAVSAEPERPAARGLRSENEAVHADRHLLQHAPSAVRRGRQQARCGPAAAAAATWSAG